MSKLSVWTAWRRDELIRLWQDGQTAQHIADYLSKEGAARITRNMVVSRVRDWNIKRKSTFVPVDPINPHSRHES